VANVEADKTLEQLEGDDWGEPRFPSYVVTTCHRIRRKPLRELSIEELRLALGQQMGVRFLLPMAVERLQSDPLASGDMYQGALLQKVLTAAESGCFDEAVLRDLDHLVDRFEESILQMDESWAEECLPVIAEAVERYRACRKK